MHGYRSRRAGFGRLELLLTLLLTPLLVLAGLAWASGDAGIARVGDDQVAVVFDHWSGRARAVTTPGRRVFVPWLQQVVLLDKSPIEYRFGGNDKGADNRYPRLLVRANDGSSFWFDAFSLSYAILPAEAARVLFDAGPGEAYKKDLVNAFARSVLRDEFGRFSAEEVVRPENLQLARTRARDRMNALLHPHGLDVLEIAAAKPRFDQAYEKAIERRKVGNQEVEHLRVMTQKLEQERIQRIAKLKKEKESQMRVLEGDLEQNRLSAEKEAIKTRRDADIYVMQKAEEARVARTRKEQEAAALEAAYSKEAEGMGERAKALEAQGADAVRAALIEKLVNIEFTLMPYRRDPAPERVEHTGSIDGKAP